MQSSKEPPIQEDENNKAKTGKGPVLLQHELPVDPHGGPAILLAVVAQAGAYLSHALEAISTVQQVLNVLCHNLCHVAQLVIEAVEVRRGARVGIGGLCLCDEGVELHKGVGSEGGGVDLGGGVGGGELAGEVGEVGEGELARVRGGADGEEDDVRVDEVVEGVGARLDRGLRLGVAGELAEDLADVLLGLCEGCFGLDVGVSGRV